MKQPTKYSEPFSVHLFRAQSDDKEYFNTYDVIQHTMQQLPSESDVARLFAGSSPTQRSTAAVGTRSAHPRHVKLQQGRDVFEYVKLRFGSLVLEKAVQ